MDNTKNRVTYGLSNVMVWPITSTSDAGKPTYGTGFKFPGAVELSIDPNGSSDPFYADDNIYYQPVSNTGYTGSLTVADIVSEFLTQIMGEETDANGAHFESADTQPKEFAMAFEFKGDQKKRRHVLYRCKATRPSIGSKTKEEGISPNTPALDFSALPRLDDSRVKAWAEESDKAYATWFTETEPYQYSASA